MKKNSAFLILLLIGSPCVAQEFFIYHGQRNETIIYDANNNQSNKVKIKKNKGDIFTVRFVNPNLLFYNYNLEYEQQEFTSENREVTDALAALSVIINSRMMPAPGGGVDAMGNPLLTLEPSFEAYKQALTELTADITSARTFINNSDQPEIPGEAIAYQRTGGVRLAINLVIGLSSSPHRFNDPNLLTTLNGLSNAITGVDNVIKEAFTLLNNSLVQKVNAIKQSLTPAKTVVDNEFVVSDKPTKVYLTITKVDASNNALQRDLYPAGAKKEIATIIPYYERAVLELVPVGNILMARNIEEFYLENNIVKSRKKKKTSFSPGAVVNANLPSFGATREMAVGVGLGYKISDDANVLESLYISGMFSYKNILRVGVGLGFSQYPVGLKDGALLNNPLPESIKNLNDFIDYEEKPTVFMTIAFAGLNLTKKK